MASTPSGPITSQLFAGLPLLAGLAEHELAELAAVARVDHFAPEAAVFNQGDPSDRFWMLADGRLKIVHLAEDGREVILEVISPGEVFGGAVLFMPAHPATARALTPAETISFPTEIYSRLIDQHPPIARQLVKMLGTRLFSQLSLQVLAGERVERRLAHILLKLADRAGRAEPGGAILVTIPLTRQDLAEMAGTTLETAIRTMSRFRAQGWVETRRGGYVLIRDLQQLQAQAGAQLRSRRRRRSPPAIGVHPTARRRLMPDQRAAIVAAHLRLMTEHFNFGLAALRASHILRERVRQR